MSKTTDLAVELYENVQKTVIDGVKITEIDGVTTVDVLNANGEKEIGKPIGRYITCEVPSFVSDTDIFDGRLKKISDLLNGLLPETNSTVLVAGLGNLSITADALGPMTSDYVLATRHIVDELSKSEGFENMKSVATIATGVLGKTGIETAEIIKGVSDIIKPCCVIVVDALAASSKERLGTTIQLSDSGISPGSGVGNHRYEISKSSLGVPVISVGIPTVLSTALISADDSEALFVTPREIDKIIQQGAKLIGMSINVSLQKGIDERDLFALVG